MSLDRSGDIGQAENGTVQQQQQQHQPLQANGMSIVWQVRAAIRPAVDPASALSSLSGVYESVREDPSRFDSVFVEMAGQDIMAGLIRLVELPDGNTRLADKAAFVLSGLMSRAPSSFFALPTYAYFVRSLVQGSAGGRPTTSTLGRLEALANILKIDTHREMVWKSAGAVELIVDNLVISTSVPVANVYKAAFCLWLFTFNASFIPRINCRGLTLSICTVFKETRIEKNLLKDDDAAETIIEMDVFQVVTLLEYEKWKDLELYEEIRDGIFQLDQKIKYFSNFDRYCLELDKAKLRWSVLHSEKFWRENVMSFEHDEFSAVRKLSLLLQTSDLETVAVAAYDLGEFARLHPAGKKVCQNLKVKDMVMLLITHRDRTVAREALLCIQKLMLKNWQAVVSTD
eukprot:GHVQ01040295.1.p1 GENE.GHVQ01040295.1~~GHVQ01040295.1.p1  ORF type:complete len:401 (-),score=66.68 GHVQ01040295.1:328-1530(-)